MMLWGLLLYDFDNVDYPSGNEWLTDPISGAGRVRTLFTANKNLSK